MDMLADYKTDYLSDLNRISKPRKPLFTDDAQRAAYISVLINLVWFTVAVALLGTVAAPIGIMMLIVFMFTTVKQAMNEDFCGRFNRQSDE